MAKSYSYKNALLRLKDMCEMEKQSEKAKSDGKFAEAATFSQFDGRESDVADSRESGQYALGQSETFEYVWNWIDSELSHFDPPEPITGASDDLKLEAKEEIEAQDADGD